MGSISTGFGQHKNFIDQPYIEVNGYADTLVTPNQIFIKIVIAENDFKTKTATIEEYESKMFEGLKNLGVNIEENLTVKDLLSNYKFYLIKKREILKSKEYILKVSDVSTANKVFAMLEDEGIARTSIYGVNHTELKTLKNICRLKAIENAKQSAVALTKSISQTIGSAIYISDGDPNTNNNISGRLAGVATKKGSFSNEYKTYQMPTIEFEKIEITSLVNVIFILNQ